MRDTSRKPNASAGKTGGRYMGGPGDHLGTNNVAPGATVSPWARTRVQAHSSAGAQGVSPLDKSTKAGGERAWESGPGNAGPMKGGAKGMVNLPAGDRPRRGISGRR